jgi:hypothetical protein
MACQITAHELRVYRLLQARRGRWLTTEQIAEGAEVAGRTARHHALRLARLGVADRWEVFGGYRYRLAGDPADYVAQLEAAGLVLGV